MDSTEINGGDYEGTPYEFTASVNNFRRLPRFGHGSDFTAVFSSDQDEQVDYAAGLIALFVFLLIVFIFWTIVIITFKIMGPTNAGFLSGHHFVVPDPAEDEKNIHKRPRRVRIVFLVATALLMLFSFLLVAMGLTNVQNASATMGESLKTTDNLLERAGQIAQNLEEVGDKSIEIRDKAVAELDNLCPANPNIADAVGMDIMGIAEKAKTDLTMLANFIQEGLNVLNTNIKLVRGFAYSADNATKTLEFWDWEMKLLSAGLFILPAFLAVGVGLVMLDVDVEPYQRALTYFFTPLFVFTIIVCYIVCCAMLPISATAADVCSGGGNVRGGPDDTVLTIFRNLRGDNTDLIYQFVGFYTQQCDAKYNPFGFLETYLNDLDNAVDSTTDAANAMQASEALLTEQCNREFGSVIQIVIEMNDNLKKLQRQVDNSLDLVQCENINQLYVNTVHEAGCTYSVDAMAWIFASALVISVCGLIMIMLRSAYYPVEYLELGESWNKLTLAPTKSLSKDSLECTDRIDLRKVAHSAVPAAAPANPPMAIPRSIKVSQVNDDEFEMNNALQEF
mmetsp:Transcript_31447/g.66161  ORF Transcript_31447/g.66161 Transcript_31447/m.66161 type:complete len:564 (-) Transcript_31447:1055-2746(-)|eukprot:CAMPEP_0172314662 /NCGR_PEP_ID=MMETSP1058-20130122/23066_1 /TAXON_ID=83371 /ORGANISM="Detonula confervacea, Strain CCMP 353" /LENGTH=563 /DNA_ID=CAMNT_0013028589 /DNA_START=39 /DNA_END=1730 /DNA_ORIENTATION=+